MNPIEQIQQATQPHGPSVGDDLGHAFAALGRSIGEERAYRARSDAQLQMLAKQEAELRSENANLKASLEAATQEIERLKGKRKAKDDQNGHAKPKTMVPARRASYPATEGGSDAVSA